MSFYKIVVVKSTNKNRFRSNCLFKNVSIQKLKKYNVLSWYTTEGLLMQFIEIRLEINIYRFFFLTFLHFLIYWNVRYVQLGTFLCKIFVQQKN